MWQPTKNGLQSTAVQSPTCTTTVRPAGGGPQYQNHCGPIDGRQPLAK